MGGSPLEGIATILHTINGGVTWQAQTHGMENSLASVYFVNAMTGWAVGVGGTILTTNNSGMTWQLQESGTTRNLSSVYFVNATIGWAVGIDGTILSTRNSGVTWQAQASGTTSWLHSVDFVNAMTGWVVGDYGTILSTTDSGQTWKDPTLPYSRAFAPWYYLSLLFLTPLLYLAFRKPKPIEAQQKTVADMLVSDRPISAGDPDPLEFNAIARGLSRFLRNENTQPPLTIAVTGEWGSGKSSLMNLLKADLARYGFRPVWFNAWHHQKEEHLLAALLQNIRKQALPRWWRPEGMSFRARLFWRRVRRYRVLALVLLAGFSVAVGYFAADHPTRLHEAVQQIEHLFTGDAKLENTILGWLQHKLAALGKTSVLALLSSLGAALLVLWRGLRAFGVNPANLMASLSSNFKLSEAKAQMGFRHDFAREFSEVTAALNPRTMLILIDDLDRCRPENVLEVLEAVNFLVSSGECYVVMGLDLTRVERCVGLGFKDVAEELIDDSEEEDHKDEGKIRRTEFARQYLEKLINIEVPVPQPQPEQSQNLIVPQQPVTPRPLTWWQNLLQISAPVVRKVAPVLLVAAVLVGSMWFSVKYFSPQRETPDATTVAQTTAPATTSTNQPTPSTTTPSPQRETPTDSSRGTGELIQPVKKPTSFTFVYIALAVIFGLGVWRLSIPSDLVVKDSPEFIDALKIWHPLLIAKRNTPRSVKRFVNRVRYFAMRQSAETEAQSVWQKLSVWAGFKEKEEAKQVEAVPESMLVALSAIHHFKSDLFKREHFKQTPEGDVLLLRMVNSLAPEEAVAMRNAMEKQRENFGGWPPTEEDYEKLQRLAAGIRIN
ncbi:MAG: Ycf48-like protein [bacterium]|nr:Ycf48-like protein [bacterium]